MFPDFVWNHSFILVFVEIEVLPRLVRLKLRSRLFVGGDDGFYACPGYKFKVVT